jgi:hypothetical protein
MLTSFWSGLGGELAKQWAVRLLTPALAFWLGGLAAVWWHAHGDAVGVHGWAHELQRTAQPLEHLPAIAQGLLVVGALMVVAASGLAAERLTLPLLRLLEGYWPWWLRGRDPAWRRRRRVSLKQRRDELSLSQRRGTLTVSEYADLRALEAKPDSDPERLVELRAKRVAGFSQRDAAALGHARAVLRYTPERDASAMPTRLGDVLRTCEGRPAEKYGLDTVVSWTALWMVMPVEARTEIVQARNQLDGALRMWLWGALFVVWTPWTPWAVAVAVVVPAVAYYGSMLPGAKLFGNLVVTAYDLYRMRLYDALSLPRPTKPAQERRDGERVTALLYGGLDDPSVTFTHPPTT